MKRPLLAIVVVALALWLGACAPATTVENNVQPTVIAVSGCGAGSCPDTLVVQGRYLGDGAGGENSYLLVGADINGYGGFAVDTTLWTPTRIEAPMPQDAGYGYVFVVVDGVRSMGMPANLP